MSLSILSLVSHASSMINEDEDDDDGSYMYLNLFFSETAVQRYVIQRHQLQLYAYDSCAVHQTGKLV